ncbi:hypothetical protein Mal64_38690 [Pseudobythopirellula maris]|uniref:PEP-CTERM protein-sorting domain-containing protein n=1 Tax=Pseudobythopirellula maris TaxID=2527991 RepID=A0A5C5ZGP7_9BACT|nr:hypothetical protein [Pseudobythopirellula maris]TWT86328.1 hypothetical protein Mal64_38690 [Pseudobythopirellula maris]
MSTSRIFTLVLLASLPALVSAQNNVRTLNLDFGNGGAYAGDDGVLSSSGGSYWNEVTVQSFAPGSGVSIQFNVPTLLDEFGQPFGDNVHPCQCINAPNLTSGFHGGVENVAAAFGPLSDGVTLEPNPNFFGFSIRELKTTSPVDLVVYFNRPGPSSSGGGTIVINPFLGSGVVASTALPLTGVFPGVNGGDYLRFDDVEITATTLGFQSLPGVIIGVPVNEVANIAAIQIRGEFVYMPEPAAATLLAACGVAACLASRRRASL